MPSKVNIFDWKLVPGATCDHLGREHTRAPCVPSKTELFLIQRNLQFSQRFVLEAQMIKTLIMTAATVALLTCPTLAQLPNRQPLRGRW